MRVPGSRGGRVLHASGRVGGRGGRGESGERRWPNRGHGMVMVCTGRAGTAAGHDERGAGCLLERVAAAVVLVVR